MSEDNLPAVRKRGRPAKVDTMLQTREVAAMLLTSRPRSEIIEHCCDKYGIQESSVAAVVTRAYEYIRDTHSHERDGLVASHIEKYYDVYRTAMSLGDSRGAIQALNSIEKLLKLVAPETAIQNNNINLDVSKLTVEELKELINPKST